MTSGADPILDSHQGRWQHGAGNRKPLRWCDHRAHYFPEPLCSLKRMDQRRKVGVSAIRVGRPEYYRSQLFTFMNLDDAVNANGSPHGLLVEDCTSPSVTGLRGYFLWAQGSDIVVLGNSIANSTREHIVRATGVQRMLVAENTFANLDRRPDGSRTMNPRAASRCIERLRFLYRSQ